MSNHNTPDDETLSEIQFPSTREAMESSEEEAAGMLIPSRQEWDDLENLDSVDDMSDDADALASAGHGMDEDYQDPRDDWDSPVEVDCDRE